MRVDFLHLQIEEISFITIKYRSMQYPKHIAFIPDGNRTWAKEQGKSWLEGHLAGFQKMIELAKHLFSETETQVFTVRGLSTENMKERSQAELSYLFELYKQITEDLYQLMEEQQINFRLAGNREELPEDLIAFLEEKEKKFRFPTERTLVLAVNYGGQDELLRAMNKLQASGEPITKENLEKHMDFAGLPTVDLMIRTKQKLAKRLSGFMLWWIGYAQLYFTDLYCPEFTIEEMGKALERWRGTLKSQNFGK